MLEVRKQKCINKFKKTHGDTYRYDKFVYVGMRTKATITCKIHGDFEQTPDSHSRGAGCKKCANEALSIHKTKDIEDFLNEVS